MTEVIAADASTAECPGLTFTLAGAKDDSDEWAGLDDAVTAWSDGYNMNVMFTLGTDYHAAMLSTAGAGSNSAYAAVSFGADVTAETAPNGAYATCMYFHTFGTDGSTVTELGTPSDSGMYASYLPTEVVEEYGEAYGLCYYYGSYYTMYDGDDKYLWSTDPTLIEDEDDDTNGILAVDFEFTATFYMPTELEDDDYEGETDPSGDRLNVGDNLVVIGGLDAVGMDADCSDGGVSLKKGAASLAAAASLALAAALTF